MQNCLFVQPSHSYVNLKCGCLCLSWRRSVCQLFWVKWVLKLLSKCRYTFLWVCLFITDPPQENIILSIWHLGKMEIVAAFYWLYKDSIDTLSVKYYKDEQISRQDLLSYEQIFSHTATSIFHDVKSRSTWMEFIHVVSYDSYVMVSLSCV